MGAQNYHSSTQCSAQRGQDVGHKITKPRKKSSTGWMKSPLCSAPSSLVTQRKVCRDHGHPTWGEEAPKYRAPAPQPQPLEDVQGANPQGKIEA